MLNHLIGGFSNGFTSKPVSGKSFTIRIKGPGNELLMSRNKPKQKIKQKTIKMPAEFEEPKVKIRKANEELDIIVELPGINSINDINLMHLGESLEIRAVSNGKGYFKIISVPKDYKIINKSINDGVLEVRMR